MNRPLAALVAALALAACGRTETASAPTPAPAPVAHAEFGLRLISLPPGVTESGRDADRWSFAAGLGGVAGTITIAVTPREIGSINLVEQAKRFGAAAAAAPGGKFFGGNEMVTPSGPAYAARALIEGGAAEERRVFMLHPADGDRLVTLAIRYPPSTSEVATARFQQLIDVLSELEAASGPAPAVGAAPAPTGG